MTRRPHDALRWMAVMLVLSSATGRAIAQDRTPAPQTEPHGFVSEPLPILRTALFAGRSLLSRQDKTGIYLDLDDAVPAPSWLAAGPGYRYWSKGDRLLIEGSAAISWRGYRRAHARVELPRLARGTLAIGSQLRWQTLSDVNLFAQGPDSLESSRREYRLRSTDVVGYAALRPLRWAEVGARIGWLNPSVSTAAEQPSFLHVELSAAADTRDAPDHPRRGGLTRVAAARYADRDNGRQSFTRYEAEAARFVPLAGERVVVALHGWTANSHVDPSGEVPFYLQPALGGHNTLRSFADYRFRDRNLLLVNVETRVALMTHVDAAVFADAGSVAPRLRDLTLDRRSYGAGLRLHSRRRTFARVDVAHGAEGWRLLVRFNDPLSLPRLMQRTTAVPFVP